MSENSLNTLKEEWGDLFDIAADYEESLRCERMGCHDKCGMLGQCFGGKMAWTACFHAIFEDDDLE